MSTEKTTRRDRVIMGLGIVALLLFVANIFTMVKQRFFDHRPHGETVVVHEMHPVPHVIPSPHIVVAPRFQYGIHVRTERSARTRALLALKVRLDEEANRLSAEAAQLADAGYEDASISLRESVDDVRIRIDELQRELDRMQERMESELEKVDELSFTVVTPSGN